MIPPEKDAAFVCAMEEVLDLYHKPYDELRPVVCMDEANRQLVSETCATVPAAPGRPERVDYEYRREGTANLFLATCPLLEWREVQVTAQRTATDFAVFVRFLADEVFEDAEELVLVVDNLNTHTPASFYKAFPPEEARRLAQKVRFVYTPKHGSWLNMAELELSALQRQCLDRRIGSIDELRKEVEAWREDRNERQIGVRWQFTTADARVKLHRLYPDVQLR